jgi:hypothetical protein
VADWVNHVAIATPRNGTTTHTVDPSTGTVAAGSTFTPTAGRLLVCFVEGGVTSTTPAGWTLPTNGSAINNSGLYVFYKTAAGSDTLSTTHNGSNYPVVFDFYEFPSGSTFNKAATATGVARAGGAGPTLSSITGPPNWLAAAVGSGEPGASAASVAWSAGTEQIDTYVPSSGTDGYAYSLSSLDSSALTSWSSAATITGGNGGTTERLVVAVSISAGAPAVPPILVMATRWT